MSGHENRSDTRIGEQSSLRSSSGRSWLIIGALLMVISGGLLLALSARQPMIGYLGAGTVVVLYALMIVSTLSIRAQRARLVTLAILLSLMAAAALGFLLAVSAVEWSGVL